MNNFLKIIVVICFTLFGCQTYAQLQMDSLAIGKRTDGSDFKAACVTFNERIESFSIDPSLEFLCLNFRRTSSSGKYLKNKGEIGWYHIVDGKLMWKAPVNYLTTQISCTSAGVLFTSANETYLLDKQTGIKRWKNTFYPVYKSDSLDILLGYRTPMSNKLRAVKLSNGIELWETKVSHNYGWNQVYPVDETKRLIVADNLCEIDLLTGETKIHEAKTGVADVKASLLQGLVAVAGAAVGGAISGGAYAYSYVPMSNNVISGLVSNVCIRDSCYYMADRRNLVCLDRNLQPVWQYELPDKKASQSVLFLRGDNLYMLNYGFGLKNGGRKSKTGRPFIASFHCKSGQPLFFNQLSLRKDIVEDALITQEAAYMLFDDGLSYQELTDSVVNVTPWDTERNGKLLALLSDTLYVQHPDKQNFMPLAFDGVNCPVYTDLGKVFVVDKELNIREEHTADLIYTPQIKLKDYLCIANDNDFWIIHKLGMPVAHILVSVQDMKAVGNKLLILTTENQLLYMDLDEII